MSKKFSAFRCFVRAVYSRDYPNPYLSTRTRPIGDIGLTARDVLKRYRYASHHCYFLFFFSSKLCLLRWLGVPQISAASTIPLIGIKVVVDNLAV